MGPTEPTEPTASTARRATTGSPPTSSGSRRIPASHEDAFLAAVKGDKGDTGNGISNVAKIAGGFTIGFTDGTSVDVFNGAKGDTGSQGDQGAEGKAGSNGTNGAKGDTGKSAYELYADTTTDNPVLTFPEWKQSLMGTNGTNGTNGSNGAKGDKGDQGLHGDQGQKGDNGAKGDQGIQGVQGNAGDHGLSAYEDWLTLNGYTRDEHGVGDFMKVAPRR